MFFSFRLNFRQLLLLLLPFLLADCTYIRRWLIPPAHTEDGADSPQGQRTDPRTAELILVMHALPGEVTDATALAVREGKVLARGTLDDLEAHRGTSTQVVQLPGGVAQLGLVAAHVRLEQLAMAQDAVDLHEAKTVADVVAALQLAKPMVMAESGWLWADRLDPALLAKLSSADLDRAMGHVAVLVTATGKPAGRVNGAMLVRLGEAGVSLEALNGLLDERGLRLAWQNLAIARWARLKPLILGLYAEAQKQGVTEVHAFAASLELQDALQVLEREGRIVLRTKLFLDAERPEGRALLEGRQTSVAANVGESPGAQTIAQRTQARPRREALVQVAGVSLQLDGTLQAGTAALLEPYADLPQNGTLTYSDRQLEERLQLAQKNHVQVAIQASGDAALAQLVRVGTALGNLPQLRVDLPEMLTETTLEFLHTAGATCVIQPTLTPKDLEVARRHLGPLRMAQFERTQALAQACPLQIALDLTHPQPLRLLERLTHKGLNDAQPLPLDLAWRALATGGTTSKPTPLQVGDTADLVVWSRDPLQAGKTPPKLMASIVGGTATLLIGRDLEAEK